MQSFIRQRDAAFLASRRCRVAAVAWCLLGGAASVTANESPPIVDPEIRRATAHGPTRVLVELRTPPLPVSKSTTAGPDPNSSRHGAIAAAQREVLSRLAAHHASLIRQFETVPFLALEIDADALRALENMPALVLRIVPDRPLAPAVRP